MMRIEAFWTRRRRAAPAAEPRRGGRAVDRSTAPVAPEYSALYGYLERRYASVVVLTFDQMEALLGFALPTPAHTEAEWWTTRAPARGYSAAWISAGRTAAPNIGAKTVSFVRA